MKYYIKQSGHKYYLIESDNKTYTYLSHPIYFRNYKTYIGNGKVVLNWGFKEIYDKNLIEKARLCYENYLLQNL